MTKKSKPVRLRKGRKSRQKPKPRTPWGARKPLPDKTLPL
jgi:hypothetical protein